MTQTIVYSSYVNIPDNVDLKSKPAWLDDMVDDVVEVLSPSFSFFSKNDIAIGVVETVNDKAVVNAAVETANNKAVVDAAVAKS